MYNVIDSLLAIKIGRHTYEKKTKDIQEVKRLKVQAKMTNEGTLCDVESRHNDLEKIINTMTATHISLQPRKSKDFDLLLKAEEEFMVSNCNFRLITFIPLYCGVNYSF